MAIMNEDIKRRWVAALRSGKYKQGKDWLRRDDEYCCLGVLCDLYAAENGSAGWDFFTEEKLPPNFVCNWAELNGDDPYIDSVGLCITSMNDSGEYNFNDIAQLIEDEL